MEVTIQVVSTEDEFVKLRSEWDRILHRDPHGTVFQSWEWAFWNWSFRKAGKRLYVLAARDLDGTLRGIAPLWIREFGIGGFGGVVEFIGTRGAEYLDFIAESDWLESTIEGCLAHLFGEARWNALDLWEIREDSPTLHHLRGNRRFENDQGKIAQCSTCVRIPLPSSWDAYRASLGASTRKDINYDENRLRKNYVFKFLIIESHEPEFPGFLESLQHLHQARRTHLGDVGVFQNVHDARMNAMLLGACGTRGWTKLFVLSLDGDVVASFSGFEFRNQLFGETFSISPDERWRRLSVGNVLLGLIVRWGIERGLTAIDLTRGDEPYKQRFGGIPAPNYRAVAFASASAAFISKTTDCARVLIERSPWLKKMYAAYRR